VRDALERGFVANGVVLRGFRGLLNWQTQTNTYFSREISDRVRVVACLTTLPNVVHSDSASETLAGAEWEAVRRALKATRDDTLVVVWGTEEDAKTGAQEIAIRAKEATVGIPSETRQALHDGTNGFERILPGPDRMYPDTDLPPKKVTEERLERIRKSLPVPIWTRESFYRELHIPEDVIRPLAVSRLSGLFETLVKDWKIDPTFASVALVQFPKRLRKKGLDPGRVTDAIFKDIFNLYKSGKVSREGVYMAMKEVAANGHATSNDPPPVPGAADIEALIRRAADRLACFKVHNPPKKAHILMGLVMNEVRGLVEGSAAAAQVR
jgi:glutamyl-tRNA(Gln) amidotransferase subunit E